MKSITFFAAFIVIILASPLYACNARFVADDSTLEHVRYHLCSDGDTCTFTVQDAPPILGQELNVRLRNVEAPEIKGSKCEQEKADAHVSRNALNTLLMKATRIDLHHVGRDSSSTFRYLADVIVDGTNVTETLLEQGHVKPWVFPVGASKKERHAARPTWCDKRTAKKEEKP